MRTLFLFFFTIGHTPASYWEKQNQEERVWIEKQRKEARRETNTAQEEGME